MSQGSGSRLVAKMQARWAISGTPKLKYRNGVGCYLTTTWLR